MGKLQIPENYTPVIDYMESQRAIKKIKDLAAGAVLICAIAAVIIGCIIFIPHLITLVNLSLS